MGLLDQLGLGSYSNSTGGTDLETLTDVIKAMRKKRGSVLAEETPWYSESTKADKQKALLNFLKQKSLAKRLARSGQSGGGGLLKSLASAAGLGQGDPAATGLTDVGDIFGLQDDANSLGNLGYGLQDAIAGLFGGTGSVGALGGSPGGATGQGIGGGGGYGW